MAAATTREASPRVTGYENEISFYATRYKQGGRTVYSLNLSPAQVISTIKRPDPSEATPGNRAITLSHAQGFAKYFREQSNWVVPGMILRVATQFSFETIEEVGGVEFGVLSFPRQAASDIHILDGQHRTLGFFLAAESIAADLDKARSRKAAARRIDPDGAGVRAADHEVKSLEAQRARLDKERVDLTIVVEPDPVRYKQMFFDIADNAKGITGSVKARFDATKVVNRSLEAVLTHPLLLNRVDMELDRLGRGSPYFISAKNVGEIIKNVLVGLEGRVSRRQDDELKESDVAARANTFFDVLMRAFPQIQSIALGQLLPDTLRQTSLLGSVLMLRVLAGVYNELLARHWKIADIEAFFAKLAPHMAAPVYEGSIWREHLPGIFEDGSKAPYSRRQSLRELKDALVDWAIDKPEWLDAAPKPRPEPRVQTFDFTDDEADEILRPETARARRERQDADR